MGYSIFSKRNQLNFCIILAMYIPLSAMADDTQNLPSISLKAESKKIKTSYTIEKSKSATKLNLSLKDTPQSVTVITQQQIQDENLRDTYDVLNQASGVQIQRYGAKGAIGNGGEYAMYYARGQQIVNYQIDGVMTAPPIDSKSGSALSNLDTSIFENVTIVKGATGLVNGAGYPSASINLNRKHADSLEPKGFAKVSYGSWNNVRSEFDVQSALNKEGNIRGRAVAAYEEGDSWKSWGNYKKANLYGVIDGDISDQTHFSIGGLVSRNRSDGLSVHGLDMYGYDYSSNPYSPSFNAAPRWAYNQIDTFNIFSELEHHFSENWKINLHYDYLKQKIDAIYGVIGTSPKYKADYANFVSNHTQSNPEESSIDLALIGSYQLFGRQHELMFGASYQNIENDANTYKAVGAVTSVKPSLWDGYIAAPQFIKNGVQNLNYKQTGYYVATRLNPLDHLHIIVGTRLSDYIAESYTTSAGYNKTSTYHKITPYAGLTYDLTDDLTAYASYTEIFLPQSQRDYAYKLLAPQEGKSYEAGLKAAFYDNRLNISGAYFQSKMDHVALQSGKYVASDAPVVEGLITAGSNYYTSSNGIKTQGFEIELGGEVLPNLNVQAGYSHASSKKSGQRVNTQLPVDQFKLSSTYQFSGMLDKFTVGSSIRWQSKFYSVGINDLQSKLYTQKAYTVLDLMAKYQMTPDLSFTLNVGNLTNTKYRLNYWANTYGDPTSYTGSLTYKF